MHADAECWTPEREERLLALWAADWGAGRIAAELGGGLTRNAVIGKVHRLKLTRAGEGEHGDEVEPQAQAAASIVPPVAPPRPAVVSSAPAPVLPPQPVAPIPADGVMFIDLGDKQCHWPISPVDGFETRYCGHAVVPGSSYCARHLREKRGVGTPSERRAHELPRSKRT